MCHPTASKLTQLVLFQRWLHSCATLWSLPCSCCSWTNPVWHLFPPCLCCPLQMKQPLSASAGWGRPHQPISRLSSLWPLYRGGAQAERNSVANQDRELIWLKTTRACWLSFQVLQVPDLVHQSLLPTQDRRRRYMEKSGHRNTCEGHSKKYHWLLNHVQQRQLSTVEWKAQRKNWLWLSLS